jgi:hypothetical protein
MASAGADDGLLDGRRRPGGHRKLSYRKVFRSQKKTWCTMTRHASVESIDPYAKDFLYYGTVALGWAAAVGLVWLLLSMVPWFR